MKRGEADVNSSSGRQHHVHAFRTRELPLMFALLAMGSVAWSACGSRTREVGGETNPVQGCGGHGCDGGAPAGGQEPAEPVFTHEVLQRAEQGTQAAREQRDATGGALRLIEVPSLNAPEIVASPLGWLALSNGAMDGRTSQGLRTTLYRSEDGVHWTLHPLQPSVDEDVSLGSIAYGNGRYVLTGRNVDRALVLRTSEDAREWTELVQTQDQSQAFGRVVFTRELFFALGFRLIGVSKDGKTWSNIATDNVQPNSVAFGNGRYVLSGGGPMLVSEDGYAWRSIDLPCELPGACITDPGGGVHQGSHGKVFFGQGRFYVDELTSEDGETWTVSGAPAPIAWTGERFFGPYAGGIMQSWTDGSDVVDLHVMRTSRLAQTESGRQRVGHLDIFEPIPETVDASFEDGLTCKTAACVLVGDQLLLVPPVTQPPLPDHVPRDANGLPLLSDDCPVSQMLTCDDYGTRTGCVCDPSAPGAPVACGDVGAYTCDGAFTRVGEEWALDEIGEAGCSCDFVDPNEPATYGDTCDEATAACAAPLQCLSVTVASLGPPILDSFCTASCSTGDDCPSWPATGYCAGPVHLECVNGVCQRRTCDE